MPLKSAPYVGASAFAHKAGLHASAILKDPTTYEHINPEDVGNARIIPMSNQDGPSPELTIGSSFYATNSFSGTLLGSGRIACNGITICSIIYHVNGHEL